MKNIHILPTDKPSSLHFDSKLFLSTNPQISRKINSIVEGINIYITSDEEIKEGDWCLDLMNDKIYVAKKVVVHNLKSLEYEEYLKKIIQTTDQDLIEDGVEVINDDFLEWFVKNPSCERVEFLKTRYDGTKSIDKYWSGEYKIIIPKEETKQEGYICPQTLLQCDDECCVSAEDCHIKEWTNLSEPKQETLEEATQRICICERDITLFELGAKWQQEQILDFLYSEITERRDYSASKMCEKVIEFIENLKTK
jgi:hypothetical protein